MSKPSQQAPAAPDYAQLFKEGIQTQLQFLPKELQAELGYRQQYDPLYTQQALGLQAQFDPALATQQLNALQRRDPQWLAAHQGLGNMVTQALQRGYINPQQAQAYQQWGQSAMQGSPQRTAAYNALANQVTSDTLRGGQASPQAQQQMQQAILSRSPTLSSGAAQDMAAAVYTGQRAQQLEQQRQQSTGALLQTATPQQQQQASLGAFYGAPSPQLQTAGLAGTFMQPSNSIMSQINQIQGVTPPVANQFVNPNAGLQGAQFGLQNYQNQLASQQLNAGNNPWTNALGGAVSGALAGSQFGGVGYGTLIGGAIGAGAGAFGYPQYSDERLKKNISRTGEFTNDNIPIVEFDFDGRRWRGVLAQDVEKVRPDAVHHYSNGTLGVFYSRLGLKLEEVTNAD